MISAAFNALSDIFSTRARGLLWRALGLTVILFIALMVALQVGISFLTIFPWPWLETLTAIVAGIGLFLAFLVLMAPVTALFAGLFLDDVAEMVEARSYPNDAPGKPLGTVTAVVISLQFLVIVLLVNILALPTLFFGIGAAVMIAANAYLLSREYFGMISMRHMPVREASRLRKDNAGRVFAAGLIPAALSLVPVANFLVPFFATAYFVHIYKRIAADV